MKRIFFLGGVFSKSQSEMILKNSVGVIQNAADSLQKSLIDGMDAISLDGVTVFNLPFVGSYPKRFKKVRFPAACESIGLHSRIIGGAFLNIVGIKFVSRFFSAMSMLRKNLSAGDVLIIYSAHLPFLLAALIIRRFCLYEICLILPDLPEYMGGQGFIYSLFKRLDCFIFYRLIRKIDYCVALTADMLEKIGFEPLRSLVVEGVASDPFEVDDQNRLTSDSERRSVLYTGTLSKRYGVVDLVKTFGESDIDAELRICGEGDGKEEILEIAKTDKRIKYLGQLPRSEILSFQKQATVLINPRAPEGVYTKYSFPSKIMEYMASGRPVVMHRLPGIPRIYFEYCLTPDDSSSSALIECLRGAIDAPPEKLAEIGHLAREFVLREKKSSAQAEKIFQLINVE